MAHIQMIVTLALGGYGLGIIGGTIHRYWPRIVALYQDDGQ